MEGEDYTEDKPVDQGENYEDYTATIEPNMKEGQAVMSSFFALGVKLKKLELKWKGRTILKGKEVLTHEPIGSDRFVDSLITSIESIVSQDNSISTTDKESARVILWEKFDSFSKSCVQARFKGEFNESSYTLLKEEYDHVIELFMGHVVNSHGIDSAYKLQGGVIADNVNKPINKSLLEVGKEFLHSNGRN